MRKIDFLGSTPASEGSIAGSSLQSFVTNSSNSDRAARYLFLFFSNHSRLLLRASDRRKESMLSIQIALIRYTGSLRREPRQVTMSARYIPRLPRVRCHERL